MVYYKNATSTINGGINFGVQELSIKDLVATSETLGFQLRLYFLNTPVGNVTINPFVRMEYHIFLCPSSIFSPTFPCVPEEHRHIRALYTISEIVSGFSAEICAQMLIFRIFSSIFFSSLDTCTCEIPISFPTSVWVLSAKYLR